MAKFSLSASRMDLADGTTVSTATTSITTTAGGYWHPRTVFLVSVATGMVWIVASSCWMLALPRHLSNHDEVPWMEELTQQRTRRRESMHVTHHQVPVSTPALPVKSPQQQDSSLLLLRNNGKNNKTILDPENLQHVQTVRRPTSSAVVEEKSVDDTSTSTSPYSAFNATAFRQNIQAWWLDAGSHRRRDDSNKGKNGRSSRRLTIKATVLVLILQPSSSSPSYIDLVHTVTDALSSPSVAVLVYLTAHSRTAQDDTPPATQQQQQHPSLLQLHRDFEEAIQTGQLHVAAEDRSSLASSKSLAKDSTNYHDLYDDMVLAYVLDLAGQSGSDYTIVLQAGATLQRKAETSHTNISNNNPNVGETHVWHDYAHVAVEDYQNAAADRRSLKDGNRTCVSWLSCSGGEQEGYFVNNSTRVPTSIFLETDEHAKRMAATLRSTLPYGQKRAWEILRRYCNYILWEGQVVDGPPLFETNKTAVVVDQPPRRNNKRMFVNASAFGPPSWINASIPVGPSLSQETPEFWIAFGVNTMPRPGAVGTSYVTEFMDDLLAMVQREFQRPHSTSPVVGTTMYNAIVVVLVCGTSVEDKASHRLFLERQYADAIQRGLVRLKDAAPHRDLSVLRSTYNNSDQRLLWRAQQNLDVAGTIEATVGLSDFVMLLEDDTGFQPGFATSLKKTMRHASMLGGGRGIPVWSMIQYGFGYSGILMHSVDLPVFQQFHLTFYDEQPCDLIKTELLIREGKVRTIRCGKKFPNESNNYLKHRGKLSTLSGKEQDVW